MITLSKTRGRRVRRGVRGVVAAAVVALGLGGLAPPASAQADAQAVLDKVESFLKKAKSVEFTANFKVGEADVGTLLEQGSFPNKGRTVLTLGGDVTETIFIKSNVYRRGTGAEVPIEDVKFEPVFGVGSDFLTFERPQDIQDLVSLVTTPEIVSEDANGTTLKVAFKDPGKVIRATPNPYTEGSLEVVVATSGEPTSIALAVSGPDGAVTATADITWNKKVKISAPKLGDILDTDAVAAFDDAPVLQPAAIPKGWKLRLAQVLPAAQTLEGCDEVHLIYASADGKDGITFWEFPPSCVKEPLAGGQPLTIGENQGLILEQEGNVSADLTVGTTYLQIGTTLTRAELEEVVGKLIPFDAKKGPKANL